MFENEKKKETFFNFRRELEQKLREAKKRKREKRAVKLKELEDISEKEKNKWKSFNTKVNINLFLLFNTN